MWVQIALIAGQMFLAEITRQRPKRITFEEFLESNGPSEVRPIPYVAGTEQVTPSRIWYGDFSQRAVERDSKWTDFLFFGAMGALLDFITVGYRYYCGEAFTLCYGPDAHVEAVHIADRLMYQAIVPTDNAGGGFLIDDPQAWGGDQPPGEGGQYSWCDITRGNYTDPTNAYLESILTTPPNKTPSLRGISCLVSRGRSGFTESGYFAAGGIGFIPRFKEWKVTVRRQPNNLATAYSKVGRGANPMEVYYEHATSFEYGARLPITEINLASWQSVAQTLHGEGLGWSGKITNPTSPLEVCRNIEAQVDMVMDVSPSLGLTATLIRKNYSIGSLPLLNRDNITRIERYAPGTYEDTVNKIILPYGDRDNEFKDRPAIYIDPANQTIQDGRIVPQTQQYRGVADAQMANILATRDGRALSFPRVPLQCSVLPSFGRLRTRGEVVQFEWTSPTFSKVMRVTAVTKGTVKDPDYRLTLIEDQFATGLRTFGEPSGTGHTDPAVGLDTAPPSATWDTTDYPPDGLVLSVTLTNTNEFIPVIRGGIIFGSYNPGGQFARIWVTEPGGVQTLSPIYLVPDANNEAFFDWMAHVVGTYEFCIQTYSLHQVTNGTKVCATIDVAQIGSPSASASVSPSTSPSASISPSASQSPSTSPSTSPSASSSPSFSISPSASVSPSSSISPSVPPPAEPNTITNLELWLQADSLSGTDGDEISTWPDDSGNLRDFTGVVSVGKKPRFYNTVGPNSMPAVLFFDLGGDNAGGWFTHADFMTGAAAGHMFIVVQRILEVGNSSSSPLGDWSSIGVNENGFYPWNGDQKIYEPWGSTARKTTVDPTPSLNSWRLYEVRTASGAWSNWLDGTQLFTTATNTVGWSSGTVKVGGGKIAGNDENFKGRMAEVIVFSRILNSTEIQTIKDYIAYKYGLTLA